MYCQELLFPLRLPYTCDLEPCVLRLAADLELAVVAGVNTALANHTEGNVLVFLPGAGEIRRVQRRLEDSLPATCQVLPLHGSLSPEQQDAALRPQCAPCPNPLIRPSEGG